MTHGSVAKKVRLEKEAHPERFCSRRECLWRIISWDGTSRPCRNHSILTNEMVERGVNDAILLLNERWLAMFYKHDSARRKLERIKNYLRKEIGAQTSY